MAEIKLPDWLEKAIETHRKHREFLRSHDKWTMTLTSKKLLRSIGSISEDLMIARWYRIHPSKLEKMTSAMSALEWIRDKEKEQEMAD